MAQDLLSMLGLAQTTGVWLPLLGSPQLANMPRCVHPCPTCAEDMLRLQRLAQEQRDAIQQRQDAYQQRCREYLVWFRAGYKKTTDA